MRSLLVIVCLFTLLLTEKTAQANGRPPAPVSISLSTDANRLLVGTTFGALLSNDAGATWSWLCEPALQMLSGVDPVFVWLPDNRLLATSFAALLLSPDGGCTWESHPSLTQVFPTDLQTFAGDANHLWVTSGHSDASTLYVSHDAGNTFTSILQQSNVFFGSVRIDPSNMQHVVVGGWNNQSPETAYVFETQDGGQTWQSTSPQFPSIDYLGAVAVVGISPNNPNNLFLAASRVFDSTTGLYRRGDDGRLTNVLQVPEPMRGMVFEPNSTTVWATSTNTLQVSNDNGQTFTLQTPPHGWACAQHRSDTWWVCGNYHTDDWTVAQSQDSGATWTGMFSLPEVQGPLSCPAGTTVQQACPALWDSMAATLGVPGATGTARAIVTTNTTGSVDSNCACNAAASALPITALACLARLRRRLRL